MTTLIPIEWERVRMISYSHVIFGIARTSHTFENGSNSSNK